MSKACSSNIARRDTGRITEWKNHLKPEEKDKERGVDENLRIIEIVERKQLLETKTHSILLGQNK